MTILEAFDAAHAVCGNAIVPPDYRIVGLFSGAIRCDPETLSFKEAVNAGIVHTMLWLAKNDLKPTLLPAEVEVLYGGEFICESHDGTPASLYAAMLKIAARVAKEKPNE